MAGITMCTGGDCPDKEECYRYTATPSNDWQSYMAPPRDKITGKCEFFLIWVARPRICYQEGDEEMEGCDE